MQETYNGIWRKIASGIRRHLSADAFQRWFAVIELVQADELALTFQVPNTIYQLWIESNYLNLMQSATLAVLGSPRTIKFRVTDTGKPGSLGEPCNEAAQTMVADQEPEAARNHGM